MGSGSDIEFYKESFYTLLEQTRKYPYNSKLLLVCANRGINYMYNCVVRKCPEAGEKEILSLYKDLKRIITTAINFENDISPQIIAK